MGLRFVRKGGSPWAGWWIFSQYSACGVQDLDQDAGTGIWRCVQVVVVERGKHVSRAGQRSVKTTSVLCFAGESVLMVHQENSRGRMWTLPGGKVDPGETYVDAVVRECAEETALVLSPANDAELCGVSCVEAICPEIHLTRMIFETQIAGPTPRPLVNDIGGEVLDAEFTPLPEARRRLEQLAVPAQREPFLAALAGVARPYYCYKTSQTGRGLVSAQPSGWGVEPANALVSP